VTAVDLSEEIAAFHAQRSAILRDQGPCWVVMRHNHLERTFQSFEDAAAFAIVQFPNEPFLIRHVDEGTPHVPLVVIEAS